MAGGRPCCLSFVLACTSVLLLGVFIQDVEASSCQRVIHKKVGDTVELPSCLPTEGVTVPQWKYGGILIADKDKHIHENQFKDRLELNSMNFSLTVKQLTLKDSGNYSFLSEENDTQRTTVIISLQVHEPITKQPTVNYNSTWHTSNESCTVFLECRAASDSGVDYKWTVRNQTRSGSRLQYIISAQDGDTDFTCTIYNLVTEMSVSKTVTCSNHTQDFLTFGTILILSVVGGGCLIMVIIVIVVCVCYCKQRQSGSDANELTVYADISEVAINDEPTSKPCSVYETIDNRGTPHPVTPGPQTVYDKIQLSRVRKASVSPYQEIS
ncbi:signaling lymphocytic activation molecule-like isoform X2 [Sparus aurata]|uniref:signaling lymphocytic activation molecule-like isoform X2 n=1 Tax=Sparus aurata TaxID=8175 RepID=UPI0011C0DDAD|nr:signaling lymphocytic activation molecule-like isoform X2 [Sparus aurata]